MCVCVCVCVCVCMCVCVTIGHMLFEMACGYELVTVTPSAKDLKAVRYPAVVEVSVSVV